MRVSLAVSNKRVISTIGAAKYIRFKRGKQRGIIILIQWIITNNCNSFNLQYLTIKAINLSYSYAQPCAVSFAIYFYFTDHLHAKTRKYIKNFN